MKRSLPVLLALAAGCVSVPAPHRGESGVRPDSPAERAEREVARDSFLKLHRAWIDGDAVTAYGLMSVQGMSDWVLERTRDTGDGDWPKRASAVDGPRKVDLDAWIRANRGVVVPFRDERSLILPESILNSQWLKDTWVHYFGAEKENLRAIARSMEVADVYVEGGGMSVLVRLNKTASHIYSMTQENGIWKFEYVVRPATKVRR